LTAVLRFLNESEILRESLALKGGTAINLTVFNLPRLSMDIDLDFTENLNREDTREKRVKVNELLELYMAAEGYTQKGKTKRTHILDSYVYSYTNVAGNSDNIKVEINYSLRSHALPTVDVTALTTGIFNPFLIRILAPVEIFASKIVALTSRSAARDLYDLNNMVYYSLFDESEIAILRKCAVLYMAVAGEFSLTGFNSNRIDGITPYKVRTELRPVIRDAERFGLQEARERVSSFLNESMALTESETAFLKHFAAGRYEPRLLFDDSDIVKRVENHPMVLWRLQHIRERQEER